MKRSYVVPLLVFQLHCASTNETGTATTGGNPSSLPSVTAAGQSGASSLPNSPGAAGGSAGDAGDSAGTASGGATGTAGTNAIAGSTSGSPGRGGASNANDPDAPAGYVPALVGVGYGGIRIVSTDGGKTWGSRSSFSVDGGDDEDLLRAVVYGKGLWIATGWKLVTSNDGKTWTDHGLINDGNFLPCNIVEGLAYQAGWFYAACPENPATTFRSSDGLEWSEYGTIGNTQGHLFLTYRDGKFVAYGDNEVSYESSDAHTFTQLAGLSRATYCGGTWKAEDDCFNASWFDGAYFRADWQGKISRSENGSNWSTVYEDDQQNTLYQSRAIAAGYVAP